MRSGRIRPVYDEDLVMAVQDVQGFHQQNFNMNKKHYPATSKIFKARLPIFFSKYGSKMHFNVMPIIDEEEADTKHLRYGIIAYQDLIRDLKYWETLSVSSMMLRPFDLVYNEEFYSQSQELQEAQNQNQKSALALSILTNDPTFSEHELYEKILNLTRYQTKGLRLLETEEIEDVVQDQFSDLQKMYRPIFQNQAPFNEMLNFEQNPEDESELLITKNESKANTRHLLQRINDNVYRNMTSLRISPRVYDSAQKYYKKALTQEQRSSLIRQLELTDEKPEQRNRNLLRALEKIMITHRNTKLFLFMMSGPFLALLLIFKYSLKVVMLYLLFKYKKKKSKGKAKEEAVAQAAE